MDARGPQVMFGVGAWEQIVDRFLYCANSSKETGGSKTISGENLPAHSHYIDLSTSQAGWHKHRYWDWSGMTKGKGYDVIGRDKDGNPIFDPKLKLKLLTRQQLEKLLKPKQEKK
ncbi:phage tail repeat-like family [Trichomonas vaginalis G3]|uniref:phage tail repeat-like family n=1 Tax=Trichomonas vaginalis (strain ATCC PRA-98 / G3) TaxID=412133 RepID=UPI0021E5C522|nr:phage tail repeat-like family [Trichomonas vaginalis G3]KAI5510965.1 phage tail repeat-like family [Trichomonas vaginalis G3]